MSLAIGLDIGGTKIAGAVFGPGMTELYRVAVPTPVTYPAFVSACAAVVTELEKTVGAIATVGVGIAGAMERETGIMVFAANTPCLKNMPLRPDLETLLTRPIRVANDADAAALSEAVDGAGVGHRVVFGLILGTGVGGGLVVDGRIVQGANGLTGEIGHIPLPFREESDGPVMPCGCKQKGCIDKSASGPALARLYTSMIGKEHDAAQIAELAQAGDVDAVRVIDRFTTTIAKALVPIIHMFDPDIIVASGGVSNLPTIYEEVPKRWGKYAIRSDLRTLFVPAKHGAVSGLRGAAWFGQQP